MKIDIHKHKERYLNWKKKVQDSDIIGISKANSDLIKAYIFDMENGINVSNKSIKGSRSYIRLNTLNQRLIFVTRGFEERLKVMYLGDLKEEDLFRFFNDMRNGNIKTRNGEAYKSVGDYVNVFNAFWHWYIKVNKKKGVEIPDIVSDLDKSSEKPKWVYLNEEQVKRMYENAKYEYKALIMFLYDSGIRSPTELINIKVSDLYNDCKELNIHDEISKTFGRRIKLLLCSEILKDYIKQKELKPEDYLFKIGYSSTNKYLQRLAKRLFGDNVSEAGKKYSKVTMYDFRHCSCCYWLPRYKSESALKYRFGWKSSDKIHYYSELLGMKDTISQEDILLDLTKTEIEKRLESTEKENNILKDKVTFMEKKLDEIQKLTDNLLSKFKG